MRRKTARLGELLLQAGKVDEAQLEEALTLQVDSNRRIGEILIGLGHVKEKDIIEILEYQLGIPHIDLERHYIDREVPNLVSESLARENLLIPVRLSGDTLTVAMSDPLNLIVIEDIKKSTGFDVKPVLASDRDIQNAIGRHFGGKNAEKAVEDFKREFESTREEAEHSLMEAVNNAPIVRLVDSIIHQAVQQKASDIHIEPGEDALRIRCRIDGDLRNLMQPAQQTHGAIVARIKIMSGMDIAERRLPQDGRMEVELAGQAYDLRISTVPTIFGEKIVIRILDRNSFLKDKNEIGFTENNLKRFESLIRTNNGILLLTGPTGSGKSTTLYTILGELNDSRKNILTIEDPVEYKMAGINQMQVNTKAGLTFANGLRSMLRQDPDILMVGEIRDSETAEIAIRAAITGHLVLSTLHTNSAPATIDRLSDMGIEPYLVSSSLVGVVAQRLVKLVCPYCRETYEPDRKDLELLGGPEREVRTLHRGKGCSYCSGTGYRGRTAIHEILIMDRTLRRLALERAGNDAITDYAIANGMTTLRENARSLVLSGATTLDEYIKVAYSL